MSKIELSPRASAALDAGRAVAAIYVVIHHVALPHDFQGPFSVFKHFGHQAVMMFFLLSGFVIYANERGRIDVDITGYIKRRLVRIYPPLIFALSVSSFVAAMDGVFWERFSLASMVGTIFALQDTASAAPGTPVPPFMANAPLWSLAYEIWFYALFPLAYKLYRSYRERGSAAIGFLCGASYLAYIVAPNHFLLMTGYFAIWWLGAMIAESYSRGGRNILIVPIPALSLTATSIIAAIPALYLGGPRSQYPFLQINHLGTGIVFAALLFSPAERLLASATMPFAKIVSIVASFSYGLYVLHWPILTQWSLSYATLGLALTTPILVVLAVLSDPILSRCVRETIMPKKQLITLGN